MSSSEEDDIIMDSEEDEDEQNGLDVEVSNMYWEAEGDVEDELSKSREKIDEEKVREALASFNEVIEKYDEGIAADEQFEEPWNMKAFEWIVQIHCKFGEQEQMVESFTRLMNIMKTGSVDRNDQEKTTVKLLSCIDELPMAVVRDMYKLAFEAIRAQTKNPHLRLWYKLKMKLAQLMMERGEYVRMNPIMREMTDWCAEEEAAGRRRSDEMVQIIAMNIQLCTLRKDNDQLKELYSQAKELMMKATVDHKINGVIMECGGKMHMNDNNWAEGVKNFHEAFSSYNSAGDDRRDKCLKYLLIATMLSNGDACDKLETQINELMAAGPQQNEMAIKEKQKEQQGLKKVNLFADPGIAPFQNRANIKFLSDLLDAYMVSDIDSFNAIFNENRQAIMDDPFVNTYVEDILLSVRTQVVIRLLKPYTEISMDFIGQELQIPVEEVELLLVSCILDGKLAGSIDQIAGVLRVESQQRAQGSKRFVAIGHWAKQLAGLNSSLVAKVAG